MTSLEKSKPARIITLCTLYFAQGFPWGFMTTALVAYLANKGLTVEETGHLIAMAILPWTFKILWAPLIDTINFPPMGRRRPWILFAELMMAATLVFMAKNGNILDDLNYLGWMFFLHNCFASLQDVCTDALAVDILNPEERGQINGFMWSSKIIGVGFGASIMGTILVRTGLLTTLLFQTGLVLAIMLFPLIFREREGERFFPWSKGISANVDKVQSVRNPLSVVKDLVRGLSTKTTFIGAIFLLTASVGEGINSAILPALYMQNLGWEPDSYSQVVGGVGTALEFGGALLGGFLADRLGRRKIIFFGYGGFALTAMMFGIFSNYWDSNFFASAYLAVFPFFRAVGAVAIFSLFMQISWTKSAATMFTSYMAMANISATMGSKMAGAIKAGISFEQSFIILAGLAFLPLLFLRGMDPGFNLNQDKL
ncbi:MAG: MFS transporter [Candidatus Marinimicrobia bacterium]|nr:MFS transporter [Candidatus Neomarinimicrobiota bacterium]